MTANRNDIVRLYNFPTPTERHRWRENKDLAWPHVRPGSVFVGALGNHWAPTAWQKVVDMVQYSAKTGGRACWLEEATDRCFMPYDSLGPMRTYLTNLAVNAGMEWVCLIDNDVLPEPDILERLLAWDTPIVLPYMEDNLALTPLHSPRWKAGNGLKPIRSGAFPFALFRATVFNCVGAEVCGTGRGLSEDIIFQRFWHYGHRPHVDTDTRLELASRPTYHLGLAWDEKWDFLKSAADRMQGHQPDRAPIDPHDPGAINGHYLPFVKEVQEAERDH